MSMDAYVNNKELPIHFGNKAHQFWIRENFSKLERVDVEHDIDEVRIETAGHELVQDVLLIELREPPKFRLIPLIMKLDKFVKLTKFTMQWRTYCNVLKLADYQHLLPDEIVSRLLNFERQYHQTTTFLKELIEIDFVQAIHLDFGELFDYFMTNELWNSIGDCADNGNLPTEICINIKPQAETHLEFYNRLHSTNWMQWMESGLKFRCIELSLKLENFSLDDWQPIDNLTVHKIKLYKMKLNLCGLRKLAAINIDKVEFVDCPGLNDALLLELLRACGNRITKIKICGKSSVTILFYYMLAERRMRENGTNQCTLKDECPLVLVEPIKCFAAAEYAMTDDGISCDREPIWPNDDELMDIY